jgi:hypothetical protein
MTKYMIRIRPETEWVDVPLLARRFASRVAAERAARREPLLALDVDGNSPRAGVVPVELDETGQWRVLGCECLDASGRYRAWCAAEQYAHLRGAVPDHRRRRCRRCHDPRPATCSCAAWGLTR